jgi:hypothetical protein
LYDTNIVSSWDWNGAEVDVKVFMLVDNAGFSLLVYQEIWKFHLCCRSGHRSSKSKGREQAYEVQDQAEVGVVLPKIPTK